MLHCQALPCRHPDIHTSKQEGWCAFTALSRKRQASCAEACMMQAPRNSLLVVSKGVEGFGVLLLRLWVTHSAVTMMPNPGKG